MIISALSESIWTFSTCSALRSCLSRWNMCRVRFPEHRASKLRLGNTEPRFAGRHVIKMSRGFQSSFSEFGHFCVVKRATSRERGLFCRNPFNPLVDASGSCPRKIKDSRRVEVSVAINFGTLFSCPGAKKVAVIYILGTISKDARAMKAFR